jgi:hypothetical protein
LLVSGRSLAADGTAGEPVRLELTNATTLLYAGDNRDTKPNQVATLMNDDFGVFMNRFNAHASHGRFRASLRLDNAWYFTAPDPTAVALELVRNRPDGDGLASDPAYFRSKLNEAGRERSNRYINWLYPAKYSLGYAAPAYELTLGDVYAEFGRGLVLSVRKLDELSSDTTLRGGRLSANTRAGGLRLGATVVGGAVNPLRLDETSGRYLGVHSSSATGLFALAEAGMPRAIATDFTPETETCSTSGTCSYAPDGLFAAQLSIEHARVKLGTQGSWLVRQDSLSSDVVRSADRIFTFSQSAELTSEAATESLYLEAAGQKLSHPPSATRDFDAGYAVYGAATLIRRPWIVLLEGKHYRRFFPLYANVDLGVAREFSLLAMSAPPTTEESYVDTEFEGFNTCVTGGRARYDVAASKSASLFGWLGYYQTFAESVSNERCEISDANRNTVFDLASGFELRSRDRRSRGSFTTGARFDDAGAPLPTEGGTTHVYYRELYARYDIAQKLPAPFVLEFQGFHRRRRETLGANQPWLEGSHVTGLGVGAAWSFAFGFEYDTNPLTPDTYFNGTVRFRPSSDSSVTLFAGQQRGALRCVGGVCRVFPPFEGARLDGTVRF